MARPGPQGLLGGLAAPWRGFKLLAAHPRLWPAALAPFLINLGLFILFFWFTFSRFDHWVRSLVPGGEGWWWQLLVYLLLVLLVILLLAVEVYLFAVVGRIIAAPFLELLTRRTEALVAGGRPDLTGPGLWRSIWRVVVQEFKKLVLYLTLMSALLVLNLLPGLGNLLYTILAGGLTCFFLALEFLDYPLERREFSLGRKLAYVWNLKFTGLAFGLAMLCLGLVPILNLALLPLGAVGGTLLFLERPPADEGAGEAG